MDMKTIYMSSGLFTAVNSAAHTLAKKGDYSNEFHVCRVEVAKAIKIAQNMAMDNGISVDTYWDFIESTLGEDKMHDIYLPSSHICVL
mgnify:CR=1 FL=1